MTHFGPHGVPLEFLSPERLFAEVLPDEETCLEWCKNCRIIARPMSCGQCRKPMTLEKLVSIDGCM